MFCRSPGFIDAKHIQRNFFFGKRLGMKVLLGMFLSLSFAGMASADTVWTYAGNTMNGFVFSDQAFTEPDCHCSLNGTVTMDASMNAIAWSFTDGTHTLSNLNSTGAIDPFEQSSIAFSTWFVSLSGGGINFFSQFDGSAGEATDSSSVNGTLFGYEEGNHGIWTETVATAEPATGLLVGLGLAVAGLIRRRRKKPIDSTVWEHLG
jgi:hypothetical protein